MRSFLAASLPALLLLAAPLRAEERWSEVRTPHFQLAGNAGAGDIKRIAQRLEKFRSVVGHLFPTQPLDGAAPTTVLVLKNADALKPFFPIYEGKPTPIGGIFVEGQDRNYMALDAQARDEAYETVFHEYMHLLMSRVPYDIPNWMNEGLAELYSNAEVHDREVALGRPIAPHVLLLRRRTLIPLETFFAVDHDSPYYNEEDISTFLVKALLENDVTAAKLALAHHDREFLVYRDRYFGGTLGLYLLEAVALTGQVPDNILLTIVAMRSEQ